MKQKSYYYLGIDDKKENMKEDIIQSIKMIESYLIKLQEQSKVMGTYLVKIEIEAGTEEDWKK